MHFAGRESMRYKNHIDIALKSLLALIACLGVWQYFNDILIDRKFQALERSVEISQKRYSVTLDVQTEIARFWQEHPRLSSSLERVEIASTNSYSASIRRAVETSEFSRSLTRPLLSYSGYYEELNFCIESELCVLSLLLPSLCPQLEREWKANQPFFIALNEIYVTSDFGRSVPDVLTKCREINLSTSN